jgi:cytoskeletal protein CcmA (bactofilin family)
MKSIALLFACIALAGGVAAEEASATTNIRVGGDLRISDAVDGTLHAAGGEVTLDAPVNGDVRMAGGSVKITQASVISGDLSVAGGSVVVDGSIEGKLRAAGGNVRLDGPVTGDATVAAGTLELGPNARIEGKLEFRGEDLRRDPAAQVAGGVDHRARGHRTWHHENAAERFLHGWIWSAGLMALAALLAAALPGASQRMTRELRERPWITPLIGLLALATIPVAAVLVMITIIGIPIALLALFGYAVLLLLGYVWVAVVVGGMLLDRVKPETAARTAWHAGAAVLAMLVLAILVRMPLVGGAVKLAVLAVGVGMIVAALFRYTRPAPVAAA